jgi:hypothetical protein
MTIFNEHFGSLIAFFVLNPEPVNGSKKGTCQSIEVTKHACRVKVFFLFSAKYNLAFAILQKDMIEILFLSFAIRRIMKNAFPGSKVQRFKGSILVPGLH